jgi:hypothetical protein
MDDNCNRAKETGGNGDVVLEKNDEDQGPRESQTKF